MKLDSFTRQYLETALWSSVDESNTTKVDWTSVNSFAPEAIAAAQADCAKFQTDNATDLAGIEPSNAGHDFWLTRNRHGAGFWDGDYPADLGKRLTDASHGFGEVNIYEGDDGQLYFA